MQGLRQSEHLIVITTFNAVLAVGLRHCVNTLRVLLQFRWDKLL